jgi:mannose-6-phosphate isomerase-like protein (cupin superfamily)
MADYSVKKIGEMERGFGGGFVKARAELGVKAFGFQVIELPPSYDGYPEHTHAETGQEEVFLLLRGSGTLRVGGDEIELDPETFVRVGPGEPRHVRSGPEGLRLLAIGGTPGKAYEPPAATELDGPDTLSG